MFVLQGKYFSFITYHDLKHFSVCSCLTNVWPFVYKICAGKTPVRWRDMLFKCLSVSIANCREILEPTRLWGRNIRVVVSRVRCGASLYQLLIFAFFFTLNNKLFL